MILGCYQKKLGPQPAVFIHWENIRLDRPEAHPPCDVFLLYILSDDRCFIFMDGLRKDLATSSCTVTAIDDGRKKGATAGHCSPWTAGSRQKLLKRVGHDLVFTQAMASLPWPAIGPGVGLVIRLGVGYARVVWDVWGWHVQPIGIFWLCKEVRPLQAGYGCRAIATIPPLASPQKNLAFKEIRPERRGVVAGQSLPYLRFRARKRNNVDDVHETPRCQNIANTLVFLMSPVTPCPGLGKTYEDIKISMWA